MNFSHQQENDTRNHFKKKGIAACIEAAQMHILDTSFSTVTVKWSTENQERTLQQPQKQNGDVNKETARQKWKRMTITSRLMKCKFTCCQFFFNSLMWATPKN